MNMTTISHQTCDYFRYCYIVLQEGSSYFSTILHIHVHVHLREILNVGISLKGEKSLCSPSYRRS